MTWRVALRGLPLAVALLVSAGAEARADDDPIARALTPLAAAAGPAQGAAQAGLAALARRDAYAAAGKRAAAVLAEATARRWLAVATLQAGGPR